VTEAFHHCERCGVTSDLDSGFARVPTLRGLQRLCVGCRRQRAREAKWAWLSLIVTAPILLALVGLVITEDVAAIWERPDEFLGLVGDLGGAWFGGILTALPGIVGALVLVLLVHELGHAAAGALVDDPPAEITVGVGPTLLAVTFRGTRLVLRLFPLAGHTVAASVAGASSTLRAAAVVAAGPAGNLVLAGVLFAAASPGTWGRMLAWLSAATAVANLIPIGARGATTDGLLLLRLARGQARDGTSPMAATALARAVAAERGGRLGEARAWCERALAAQPDSTAAAALLAAVHIRRGDPDVARQQLKDLLAGDLPLHRRALALNNLAWADLLIGDPGLLDEAAAAVATACRSLPWEPAVQNTRGFVAIEQGRVEEGLAIVSDALRNASARSSRASMHAVQAIGLARLGRLGPANRALRSARRLGPDDPLLRRAEDEVADAHQATLA
jgi:Flp pilus assembly protein TadD